MFRFPENIDDIDPDFRGNCRERWVRNAPENAPDIRINRNHDIPNMHQIRCHDMAVSLGIVR
ncbi:hypothetical protein A2Z33_06495 [Candidatus Gottesmanbacteria bacterium RBG_16_52_11]|uniref:Uncharacterized protein n=1 Tax=Candidatus Gottesmanbacteria bacterium RBG_16_52_11 TaxID=1798374 RepID=A0A1F5YXJ2_9BACT|nr:MAG: hypothetical protein A2Z33_06495 [Candidatus Gottesmanbacteria bacterium RBG_16_52_11]